VLAIIMVTKCCDSGAYFTGRAIGRRKLIPWLSPGKTWEGFIGGLVTAVVVAVILGAIGNHLQPLDAASGVRLIGSEDVAAHQFVPTHYPLWLVALFGLVIGLVTPFGDLTASLLKRDAGIKDSGTTIPGFGGLIDIIDSPIVVAPVAYWFLVLMDAWR
jgi:phosphatidate cytidylyltransferase